jgi:hypothetical protein
VIAAVEFCRAVRGISGTLTIATLVHDVTGGETAPDLSDDLWRGEGYRAESSAKTWECHG